MAASSAAVGNLIPNAAKAAAAALA